MRLFPDIRVVAVAGLFSLCSFAPAWAEESDKGGLPQLDTTLFPEQLFWLAISFALLYVLMSCVALPRVAKTQMTRKQIIVSEIEAARLASETAKTTVAALEKSLSEARAKAQVDVSDMLTNVTKDATDRQMAQEKELMRRLHRAEADIAVTREAALKSIQDCAADLAVVAVEKILGFKTKGAA